MKQLRNLTFVCLFAIFSIGVMTSFKGQEITHHPVVEQIKAQLKSFAQQETAEKVYLHFDKTLYKPGEWIWFNAYCRNADHLTVKNTSGIVYVEFMDPKGTVIKKEKLQFLDGGIGGSFQITPERSGGLYKIKAWTNWMKNEEAIFEKDIMIQKAVLPILNMKLEFEAKGYGASDEVLAHVKLENLENEPLRNYKFDVKVKLEGEEYQTLNGTTDNAGKADIKFDLPKSLDSNDGLLNILIPYRGQTESISRSIPIVLNDIDLQFFPEGGDMISDMKTKVAFKALNEFGKPTDIEGIIIDDYGQKVADFSSYHDGMGAFNFKPESYKNYAAKITKPKGLDKTYPLPKSKYNGYGMNVTEQTENGITVELQGNSQSNIHLVAQNGDDILFSNSFVLNKKQSIYIPTAEFPVGISRLTLMDEMKNPQCERLVFCNLKKQLNIEVTTNKEEYLPREQVNLKIKVTDENNKPVQGKFSLSVVDESLLTYADDKQGHILSNILLETELKGEISEPNFYFESAEEALSDKDKTKAMDLLMMTHGWRRFDWQEVLSNETPIANFEKETTTIEGVVLDENNEPLKEAVISLLQTRNSTVTDENGKFVIDNVRFNNRGFAMKVVKEGYPVYRHIVNDFKSGLVIVLDEDNASLKGEIKTDGENNGVFKVALINQFDYSVQQSVSKNYEFDNIHPGLYTLEIETNNYPKKIVNDIWLNGKMDIELNQLLSKNNNTTENQDIVSSFHNEITKGTFKFKSQEAEIIYHQPADVMVQDAMAGLDIMDDFGVNNGGMTLDEVVVVEYKVPLIEKDNTTSGGVVTAEQIRNLPTKNINALAAQTAGISAADEGDDIVVRGSRSNGTDFYIDGVRVSGDLIPASEIAQIQFITGGVEARFGGGIAEVEMEEEMEFSRVGKRHKKESNRNPRAPAAKVAPMIGSTAGSGGYSYWSYNPRKKKQHKIHEEVDEIAYPIIANCSSNQQDDYKVDCSFEMMIEKVKDYYLTAYYGHHPIKGTQDVEITINKNGHMTVAQLVNSPNSHSYINYAFRQVHQWQPARKNGNKVSSKVRVKIDFDDYGKFETKQRTNVRQFYAPRYNRHNSKKRQRQDFRSTIHWAPTVVTNMNGEANLTFWNADDLNTFKITVEGFGNEGQVGRTTHNYFTQLPFALAAKIPSKVLTGDVVKIPVMLSNNTDKTYAGELKIINQPTHFVANNEFAKSVSLNPNEHKTVYLEYKVNNSKNIVTAPLTINFKGTDIEDQISEQIETKYSGFPTNEILTGTELKNEFTFEIENLVDNSMVGNFYAHPSMFSDLLNTLERMLRQPNGCFEQTSSSNYPNVMAMQMIIKNGNVDAQVHQRSTQYLQSGYQKLTGYEIQGGGFEWFGRPPAHEALSAFGLMQFVDMKKVYLVSDELIERTAKWLLSRRKGDGSWKYAGRGLHNWKGEGNIRDAYICWALSEAAMAADISKEITKSYNDAMQSKDPYLLALMANVLLNIDDDRKNKVIQTLAGLQNADGNWEGKTTSATNSKGKNLTIETTGLAVLALSKSGVEKAAMLKGVKYLATAKSNYGFGSTQATVLALKALVGYSNSVDRNNADGKVKVVINDVELPIQNYTANQMNAIQINNLQQHLKTGTNKISVEFLDTEKSIPFDVNIDYMQSMKAGKAKSVVDIHTEFKTNDSKMGETVRLNTKITNTSNSVVTNPMAIIGIPAGLNLQPWQLRELMEKEKVDYYEIFNGNLVFHWTDMDANTVHEINLDLKADIPGTFIVPASSAYLYYSNEAVSWAAPGVVEVGI